MINKKTVVDDEDCNGCKWCDPKKTIVDDEACDGCKWCWDLKGKQEKKKKNMICGVCHYTVVEDSSYVSAANFFCPMCQEQYNAWGTYDTKDKILLKQ